MSDDAIIRPTKKQKELLNFIEEFITQNGYSPSYREVMSGAGYGSVATVAKHIDNLIRRGHLKKRENSARSLELTEPQASSAKVPIKQLTESQAKWLVEKVDMYFNQAEEAPAIGNAELDKLYVLVGALKVLGLDGAANSYMPRLSELKSKVEGRGGNYA